MLQGGFQLFYTIYQDRGDKPLVDEGITNFTLNVVDRATGGFTMLTLDQGTYNMAALSFNFRAVCKENYYDSDCSVLSFCEPQDDDTLGHYNCDSNGTLVCLTGYQNPASNCMEVNATTVPPTITNETSPVTTTQETLKSDPIMTVTTTNVVTNDEITPATMGATTNQEITNDLTVSMGTNVTIIQTASVISTTAVTSDKGISSIPMTFSIPSQTTRAPALVGMDIVPIAAGAATACLLVLLLILIVNIVAVVLILKSRNRRQAVIVEGTYTVTPQYSAHLNNNHTHCVRIMCTLLPLIRGGLIQLRWA